MEIKGRGSSSLDHENSIAAIYQESDVIKLNVGGVVFQTTVTTLTGWKHQRNNFFSSVLLAANGSDIPFIDRNPDYFKVILEYLRTGHLRLPDGLFQSQLKDELAFYGIGDPMDPKGTNRGRSFASWVAGDAGEYREIITWEPSPLAPNATISVSSTKISGKEVWSSGSRKWPSDWSDEFSAMPVADDVGHGRLMLINAMGRYGWEVKVWSNSDLKTSVLVRKRM